MISANFNLSDKEEMHLQESSLFDAQNVNQYPSHHVTYAPAKFEVDRSNGLGEYDMNSSMYFVYASLFQSPCVFLQISGSPLKARVAPP